MTEQNEKKITPLVQALGCLIAAPKIALLVLSVVGSLLFVILGSLQIILLAWDLIARVIQWL